MEFFFSFLFSFQSKISKYVSTIKTFPSLLNTDETYLRDIDNYVSEREQDSSKRPHPDQSGTPAKKKTKNCGELSTEQENRAVENLEKMVRVATNLNEDKSGGEEMDDGTDGNGTIGNDTSTFIETTCVDEVVGKGKVDEARNKIKEILGKLREMLGKTANQIFEYAMCI